MWFWKVLHWKKAIRQPIKTIDDRPKSSLLVTLAVVGRAIDHVFGHYSSASLPLNNLSLAILDKDSQDPSTTGMTRGWPR
ncbi:hypothetical protein N7475_008351 [Penicillium sp. IBT 31633x]|nr:hypothetical protein N7475_008351 [Penicillium sp. IBT 31633x]